MRFCSLKTFRWRCFQGSVSHLSIGDVATVVIASSLLLTPLPSTAPGLRQPIPWLSHEPLLLSPSFSASACGGHLLGTTSTESAGGVTPFLGRVWRCGRGLTVRRETSWDAAWSTQSVVQSERGFSLMSPCPFWTKPLNLRRLVLPDDDSGVSSSAYPYATLLGGMCREILQDRLSLPLHGLRISRSRGEGASPVHHGE